MSHDQDYPDSFATGGLIPHETLEKLNSVAYASQISYDELMKTLETIRLIPPFLPPKVSFADLMKAQQDFYDSQKIRYSSNVKYIVSKPEEFWEEGWHEKLYNDIYSSIKIPSNLMPIPINITV